MSVNFQIGCDPEVFLKKNGKPASAYGLLEGTKENPFKTEHGAYQVDGMAAEFNTDPITLVSRYNETYVDNFNKWNKIILEQMDDIRKALPKGHTLAIQPTMDFGEEFLNNQPDAAKELGCDPDFCAYTLKENPRPDGEQMFRSGAGHIHIGWGAGIPADNKEHHEICANFIKMMDATVGMLMTYIDRDPRRRLLYGKAGAYRAKPYGVEYRTPSNVWLKNQDLRRCVWELTSIAVKKQKNQENPCVVANALSCEELQKVINEGNFEHAEEVLDSLLSYQRWEYRDGRYGYHTFEHSYWARTKKWVANQTGVTN